MGIRIVAQQRTAETLQWFLGFVLTEGHWARRPKLRPSTPEMLAALHMIAANWHGDAPAETVIRLAEQSRDPEVRAKIARSRTTHNSPTPSKNE